jgi:hypothetical protein
MTTDAAYSDLNRDGYAILPGVLDAGQIGTLIEKLTAALQSDEPAVLRSRGQTYGSRDLITLLPEVCELPRRSLLNEFVSAVLGSEAGLVRALFFDKPPDRKWSLPWHKDRTIAVKNNGLPSGNFRRPTMKAGIPHVEAPGWLLADMLTLRLHLDPMTEENGPLSVVPGSHLAEESATPVEIHTQAGDVFAMRPLISHSSSLPREGTTIHRRIVHLEFAPSKLLPDGYEWHWFEPIQAAARGSSPQTKAAPAPSPDRPQPNSPSAAEGS